MALHSTLKPEQNILLKKNCTCSWKNCIGSTMIHIILLSCFLEGNGIKLRSSNESRELAGILHDDEYIDTLGGLGAEVMARITSKGAMYVEEMGIPHKESYEDIAYDEMEMRDRVDEVLERLNTMGLGQEILFNELQELKEMYGKLNKKNWGQLLKGKLVDLALGKVVENDTIKFVYEQLTGHELKLTGG